jgi:hypothetical protein
VTLAWNISVQETKRRLITLQLYVPGTPIYQLFLLALLQRYTQLQWSYWIDQQWNIMNDTPAPDCNNIWRCTLLKTDWDSPLFHYRTDIWPVWPQPSSSRLRRPCRPCRPGPPGGGAEADPRAGSATRCLHYNDAFTPYRQTGEQVRDVIRRATAAGQSIPQNKVGVPMCIVYHVKCICNTNCGRSANHIPHNTGKSGRLGHGV